jgi:hypothetical protein
MTVWGGFQRDWTDERRYRFHLYLTAEDTNGWQVWHVTGTYCTVTPAKVPALTGKAGFRALTRVATTNPSSGREPEYLQITSGRLCRPSIAA